MTNCTKLINGIEVSLSDDRLYECFKLENGLQVLIISDSTTDKASAAMDVHVGHQSDPPQLPGLAHLLEHMLFLGTKKYPDEQSYKQYLSAHSGRSNAYTSQTHTNYYFDIAAPYLRDILDRFAQFFIAPLFTESATDRELNAVDSEHAKNLQNDQRRLYQLLKSLSNPSHAFHKFGTGCLETLQTRPKELGLDVRQELLQFHAQYYSASIMKLVIYGKEDLKTLKRYATELFSAIPSSHCTPPTFSGDDPSHPIRPFTDEQLGREIHVAPVRDLKRLEISWPVDSIHYAWETKPNRVLGHLLGHEGFGSLLSYLKRDLHYVNALAAGLTRDNEDWGMFCVSVDLTTLGVDHIDEIVERVYDYLALLRDTCHNSPNQSLPSWIFEETQQLADIAFRFKAKETPIQYTTYLAQVMHRYPQDKILSGGSLLYKYEPSEVAKLLSSLVPERMRLLIVSPTFNGKTGSTETWYKTPYDDMPIPADRLERFQTRRINEKLKLPHPNAFISRDFSIVNSPLHSSQKYEYVNYPPVILLEAPMYRMWYRPDIHFQKPKSCLALRFSSPHIASTPYEAIATQLLLKYLDEELTEVTYDAELAGLSYSLASSADSCTLEISVNGYSETAPRLLQTIVNALKNMTLGSQFKYDERVFQRIKDVKRRALSNFYKEEPYQHAVFTSHLLLDESTYAINTKLEALERIQMVDLLTHATLIFSRWTFVEGFSYGNITTDLAKSLWSELLKTVLPPGPIEMHPKSYSGFARHIIALNANTDNLYQRKGWNDGNINSAICTLYQLRAPVGDPNGYTSSHYIPWVATCEMLAHLLKEPCFDQLRTKEQLGYLVFSGLVRLQDILYLRVLIQSKVASPMVLHERIRVFLQSFTSTYINPMPKEVFHTHRRAVINQLMEVPKREREEYTRFWHDIKRAHDERYPGLPVFDRRQQIAQAIEQVTKNDVLSMLEKYVIGESHAMLSCHFYGNGHELPTLQSINTWKEEEAKQTATCWAAAMSFDEKHQKGNSDTRKKIIITDEETFKWSLPTFPRQCSYASAKL